MKSNIQVTFTSGDDEPLGLITLGEYMAGLINTDEVMALCHKFRETFNDMGEPLSFRVEIVSEDI